MMRKIYKGLALLLVISLLSGFGQANIYAKSILAVKENSKSLEKEYNYRTGNTTKITDPQKLQQIIVEDNLDVPKGYTLSEVTISVLNDTSNTSNTNRNNSIQGDNPNFTIVPIKDVHDVYFTNEYDSDWFEGPCSVSEEYSRKSYITKSVTISVADERISSEYGITVGKEVTKSATFQTTVAANEQLNVRIHTNYLQHYFKIMNGTLQVGTGSAYEPVGLIFKQYRYKLS